MATTMADIREWFIKGVREGHTHMIVVCDTYDYEDFPRYVSGTADEVRAMVDEANGKNMEKVMEVYNLQKDREVQIIRRRCWEY